MRRTRSRNTISNVIVPTSPLHNRALLMQPHSDVAQEPCMSLSPVAGIARYVLANILVWTILNWGLRVLLTLLRTTFHVAIKLLFGFFPDLRDIEARIATTKKADAM